MINLLNVILGGALLLAGRKLFWLFVGTVGFVAGGCNPGRSGFSH